MLHGDVVLLLGFPVVGSVVLWGRRRGAGWRAIGGRCALALSILWIVAFTMFPLATDQAFWRPWRFRDPQLIPLRTIGAQLRAQVGFQRTLAENLYGNVLLFVPLGLTLPLASERARRWWVVIGSGALLSVAIELTQTLVPMHTPDIDDVILNAVGTALGYGAYVFGLRIRRRASAT
jgi:glycopeptide antibiotics resistance protein